MRFSFVGLAASLPLAAMGFVPQSLLQKGARINSGFASNNGNTASNKVVSNNDEGIMSKTRLQMAFNTEKPTNIFDGPLALTKERDACGVGFIANTQSGG